MEYIIQNRYLRVMISSIGAELQSIRGCNGTEYLWQGDARTWADRAPNIFPYVARLTEGKYKYREKEYKMDIHGFLPQTELVACKIKDDRISFRLSSNDNIRKSYPFEFTYLLHYKLEERKICIIYEVRNEGEEKMYFGLGGHPGFCVPNEKGLAYTDYYLEFEKEANPRLIEMTDTCFVKGSESEFPLRDKKILDLRHDLYDDDALILREMCRKVSLKSTKGKKEVVVEFPNMDYLGIWHWPKVEVNYVCIEPWTSLPSRDGIIEDIEYQKNLIGLSAGKTYVNRWSIEIKE